MATSKDYINYLFEQLNNCEYVRVRPMMGEYLLYFKEKLIGDICDNRLFIKPVEQVTAILPEAELIPPYSGAKPYVAVDDTDDGEFLIKMFEAAYVGLPEKKPKKKVSK